MCVPLLCPTELSWQSMCLLILLLNSITYQEYSHASNTCACQTLPSAHAFYGSPMLSLHSCLSHAFIKTFVSSFTPLSEFSKNLYKIKNPTLSNRVFFGCFLTSHCLDACRAFKHTSPDSYNTLIEFIKIICAKSCHHFVLLIMLITKSMQNYVINTRPPNKRCNFL